MTEIALPQEHILQLNLNGGWSVKLLCTNSALRELVTGYLYNERVIDAAGDITSLRIDAGGGQAAVTIAGDALLPTDEVRPSGLGGAELCADTVLAPVPVKRRFTLDYIRECVEKMDALSVKYKETGGMHCSALFNGEDMLSLYEDIGRHNTLDKLCGDCLIRGIDAHDTLLITTGRISSDMVRKAGRMGASAIATYSEPTQLAYDMAASAGMTLIGRIKKTPQLYCGEERVTG